MRLPAPPLASPAIATSTLFTIGYEKRDLAAYVELLLAARVGVLLDVRETAWSYKPGFSKAPLRQAVERAGIAYEHAAFAGNPKVLRASAPTHAACLAAYADHLDAHPAVLDRLDALVAEHGAAGRSACLTCFERHPGDCHRAILADRWAATAPAQRATAHLGPDGCPRLASPGPAPECAAPRGARMRAAGSITRRRALHSASAQTTLW